MKAIFLILASFIFASCATHAPHVSRSKQQQVELITQTGPYAYLHSAGGGSGGR